MIARSTYCFALVLTACSGGSPNPQPTPTPTGTHQPGPTPTGTGTGNPTPAGTKKAFGEQCTQSADCKSDFCVFLKGGSSLGMCTQTCEGDIDCPGLENQCVALSDAPQKVCVPK
jgi:hypothetical protein